MCIMLHVVSLDYDQWWYYDKKYVSCIGVHGCFFHMRFLSCHIKEKYFFSIDLVLGVGPISFSPHSMTSTELMELKKQDKDML